MVNGPQTWAAKQPRLQALQAEIMGHGAKTRDAFLRTGWEGIGGEIWRNVWGVHGG